MSREHSRTKTKPDDVLSSALAVLRDASSTPTAKATALSRTNSLGQGALHLAVIQDDNVAVGTLLVQAADVDAQDDAGWTPLTCAADHGSLATVKLLLQYNADVNLSGPAHSHSKWTGDTPLLRAAQRGHVHVVDVLLAHPRIDVDLADRHGATPLYHAVAKSRVIVVEKLLHARADVNVACVDGDVPAHAAAAAGHAALLSLLLNCGAVMKRNRNRQTPLAVLMDAKQPSVACVQVMAAMGAALDEDVFPWRQPPLFVAIQKKHAKLAIKLVELGAREHVGKRYALAAAARHGLTDVVRVLVGKGASVYETGHHGLNAIEEAAERGRASLLGELVRHAKARGGESAAVARAFALALRKKDKGCVLALLKEGCPVPPTAVNDALLTGHIEVAVTLVAHKAPVNAIHSSGETPLLLLVKLAKAASPVGLHLASLLIAGGVDLDKTNSRGQTAMFCAAEKGIEPLVLVLLSAGASARLKDSRGRNVLIAAIENGLTQAIASILAREPQLAALEDHTTMPLTYHALHAGDAKTLRRLLGRGAALPSSHGGVDVRPLTLAASKGFSDCVVALCESGYPVAGEEGQCALHISATLLDRVAVAALLEHGADPNRLSRSGYTALDVTITQRAAEPIIALLLAHKAKLSSKTALETNRRKKLLRVAVENSFPKTALVLVSLLPRQTPEVNLLIKAARDGNKELVHVLMAAGARLRPGDAVRIPRTPFLRHFVRHFDTHRGLITLLLGMRVGAPAAAESEGEGEGEGVQPNSLTRLGSNPYFDVNVLGSVVGFLMGRDSVHHFRTSSAAQASGANGNDRRPSKRSRVG